MSEARPLEFDILTRAEAAKFLRMTPRALEMHMKAGSAPPVTLVGGRLRFRSDLLAEWLRDRTMPAELAPRKPWPAPREARA